MGSNIHILGILCAVQSIIEQENIICLLSKNIPQAPLVLTSIEDVNQNQEKHSFAFRNILNTKTRFSDVISTTEYSQDQTINEIIKKGVGKHTKTVGIMKQIFICSVKNVE